jgi:hypothetical protein
VSAQGIEAEILEKLDEAKRDGNADRTAKLQDILAEFRRLFGSELSVPAVEARSEQGEP